MARWSTSEGLPPAMAGGSGMPADSPFPEMGGQNSTHAGFLGLRRGNGKDYCGYSWTRRRSTACMSVTAWEQQWQTGVPVEPELGTAELARARALMQCGDLGACGKQDGLGTRDDRLRRGRARRRRRPWWRERNRSVRPLPSTDTAEACTRRLSEARRSFLRWESENDAATAVPGTGA